jgi:phosphoribosyl-ATP pyrophosphohydrolase
MSADPRIVRLEAVIRERKGADPASSYVASLFAKGRGKIAQKADLLFHLAILLADADLGLDDVLAELERREGLSGIAEKAARSE